jgi:ribosome-binding factor A
MPSPLRLQRIADRIREDLSEIVVMQVSDPRLSGISITGAKVDRELAFADIFVSAVEGHERSKEVLEGLAHASGFLRSQLASRIELRVFPRLRFHWDPTPERADHIERLLASLRSESQAGQPQPAEEPVDEAEEDA